MKRLLFTLFLILTMVFAVGCNKKNKNPEPTTAPVATATPVPVNQAKESLSKLVEKYDSLLKMQPENQLDYSKGIGYDLTMDISIGKQIAGLLGMSDSDTIRLSGTMDMKDALSANLGLYINSSEIINTVLFMDDKNILFNLPKYAADYAAYSLDELLATIGKGSLAASINPADTLQLSAEITDLYRTHLTNLVAAFKEVDGVTKKASIGTGDYVMTGDKYSLTAKSEDVVAVLKKFEADMEKYYGELNLGLEDLDKATLFLDYYTDEAGNYAWAFRADDNAAGQIVFIATDLGFCLYKTDGTTSTPVLTSIKSTENSGVIYLFLDENDLTEPTGTIDYVYTEKTLYAEMVVDTIEATMDYSITNDVVNCDITFIMDGMSFILKEKASPKQVEMTLTVASYGIEYATAYIDMTLRDYVAASVPANTVDLETWIAGMDQQALLDDLTQLITDYPILALLFNFTEDDSYDEWEGEEWSDGTETQREEPFVLPAGYTDDFMNMTGWSVDTEGYVDFEPLEIEVFAIGKPSSGYDRLAVTEDQIQKLFATAEASVKNYESSSYPYYWIWGSAEYEDVQSYYVNYYEYCNVDNWDDYICLSFDAVSGDFIGVDIYNPSKDEALRIANEMFQILGGTYTITDTIVENYTYDAEAGFCFFGYDGTPYGDNLYSISINAFNSDWE